MTLLDDLQAIDLTPILQSRGSITAAVQSPDLQAVVAGGAARSALGGLGSALATVQDAVGDPAALLRPLADAAGGLVGSIHADGLPLDDLLNAVREGATIAVGLVTGLAGDPASFGSVAGTGLGELLQLAGGGAAGFSQVGLDDVSRFRTLLETVERGVPAEPAALASLAVEALLPFPGSSLRAIRSTVDGLVAGTTAITLPGGRTGGLVGSLDAVADAAATGDAGRVAAELATLDQIRGSTIGQLREDLLDVHTALSRLRVPDVLSELAAIGSDFRSLEGGILEFLERFRREIASVRAIADGLDVSQLHAMVTALLAQLEQEVRSRVLGLVDEVVGRVDTWVRDLFGHLPLRQVRAEVSAFIHGIAQAIEDAHLDGPAGVIRDVLEEIRSALQATDLSGAVHEALQQVKATIDAALQPIVDALSAIGGAVNGVAGTAGGILEGIAAGLTEFRASIDAITGGIEALGVEHAAKQVIDTLTTLREAAQAILTELPLPEPIRPVVEQLIDVLDGVDIDALLEPVHQAAAELRIPDDVAGTVSDGLERAKEVVENLIPAELIASIDAEVSGALDVVRGFDPSTLLDGVGGLLQGVESAIRGIDPVAAANEIRGPFQAVLDGLDRLKPSVLLAPVAQAYDELMGDVHLPSPETLVRRTAGVFGAAGDAAGRSMVSPVAQLVPGGSAEVAPTATAAGGGSAPAGGTSSAGGTPPGAGAGSPEPPIRTGDVVRMFGYIPARLREGLAALEAGPAGEAVHAVDALCGGLARDLRALRAALWEVEARVGAGFDGLLAPVGEAQVRATVALSAHASMAGLDLDVSLAAVAAAGPGPIRAELGDLFAVTLGEARDVASSGAGGAGAAIERIATALERSPLASLAVDVDLVLAALDPEPAAAELDALTAAVLAKAPEVLAEIGDELTSLPDRVRALLEVLDPGALAERFLAVIDTLREELDVLNPHRLADELDEVHVAIRATVAAYDPAVIAGEVASVLSAAADTIHGLDPATLLGDLTLFDDLGARIEAAVPTAALEHVGDELTEVGEQLAAIDVAGLLDAVSDLPEQVTDAFEEAVEGIRREIVLLLEALRYATGGASASVSVSAGVGGG